MRSRLSARHRPCSGSRTTALATASDAAQFLLVLDNAKHLTKPVGAIVTELLIRVPRLNVLVTSQRSLGISGEHEVMAHPAGAAARLAGDAAGRRVRTSGGG
jgi:predicted ATPase